MYSESPNGSRSTPPLRAVGRGSSFSGQPLASAIFSRSMRVIFLASRSSVKSNTPRNSIVGSKNPRHIQANVEMFERGLSLPSDVLNELRRRYEDVGYYWPTLG